MVVLLTDYGTQDPFVGIVKGVLGRLAPQVMQVDLTHAIPPGDIRRGAIFLWEALPYFPAGSVFLAVVDPGVGTRRIPIIISTERAVFVGPDNGIFSFVIRPEYIAREISSSELILPDVGSTFHGRDVFAPAAAYAAMGVPIDRFGDRIERIEFASNPKLSVSAHGIRGQVLFSDRFGNILTSLGKFFRQRDNSYRLDPWLPMSSSNRLLTRVNLEIAQLVLPNGEILAWANTFADVPEGKCAFLVGGSGLLEIVSNRTSAAEILNLSEESDLELVTGGD
jgi:S-adenosylmethionine hydrolase